ncbi:MULTISPECIES: hypothetical protein [unclassified Cupriavidus]|uniref:hypothetical protein n=1 Tax=unclassified Cupriavidus TaxID=2640874 RepID=UPI001C007052|nr:MULTISPECIES: hypothetical protein [unclassified Cupriavidus]MCA3194393.1 hypothetical protein [Cupriavidus sp.]MCA3198116.1 hypothetical protein [Cupriavidus sp.]MCA3209215.1 hypothetical protein [Cupriavidus sp.]MCA3235093.1 hypothetical protein [Cupriavidus sp.]QWE93510.1 hypothetical protein KLP38_10960 [Cupriavidus sp. EM10]
MPVDFSRLPEEVPVATKGPSAIVWSSVFILLTLAGTALALLCWPRETGSGAPWFWITVTVFPVCLSGALALRPFSYFHRRRNEALALNTAVKAYRNAVFDVASVPLAVLACAYLLDAKDSGNTFDAIRRRADSPPTRQSRDSQEMIVASLLEPKEAALAFDDSERQEAVLSWILESLLARIADALKGIPPQLAVAVRLEIQSMLEREVVLDAWRQLPVSVRPACLAHEPVCDPSGGLRLVDTMLDAGTPAISDAVTLIISANLSQVRDADPESGSCEAACVLLVCPAALAREMQLSVAGWLHRPQASDSAPAEGALHFALRWGRVEASATAGVVSAGLDEETASQLRIGLRKAGRSGDLTASKDFALDTLVGNTGPTAPWLAVTLALQQAVQSGAPYIVSTQDDDHVLLAVVAPVAQRARQGIQT